MNLRPRTGPGTIPAILILTLLSADAALANGEKLMGVHWWDYGGPGQVGDGPDGGWDLETIITHSDPWWRAPYFAPLYADLVNNHSVSMITRIDYNWGETVPSPTNPDSATWHNTILNDVISQLGGHAHIWVLGNEPNIIGEGNNWADNKVTPAGYAQIYHQVRSAIKAIRPDDEVLLAPVSPGGVIPGVRWMDGNQWLAQAIQEVMAIPGADIDGFAIHGYGGQTTASAAASQFRNSYAQQLDVIDNAGFEDVPVYITEWNRYTSIAGDPLITEAISADFLRLAVQGVDEWNKTNGNHNIKAMTWFIGNKDYGEDWDEYSLEYWRYHGNPEGTTGDLWTAMMDSMVYNAGIDGTYYTPQHGDADGDFDVDLDDYNILALNWGTATTLGAAAGDFDKNGVVENYDYRILKAFFGTGVEGQSLELPAMIPEPGSLAVMSLGFILIQHRRPHAQARETP